MRQVLVLDTGNSDVFCSIFCACMYITYLFQIEECRKEEWGRGEKREERGEGSDVRHPCVCCEYLLLSLVDK